MDMIEWIRIGKHIDQEAKMIRKMLKSYTGQNKTRENRKLVKIIDPGDYEHIEKIRSYFDEANKKNDPKCILQAYTEETEFYRRLNRIFANVCNFD